MSERLTTLVWLRQDLRLSDQPALCAAAGAGGPVTPVFVWSPEEEGAWTPGGAGRWWLHHSLAALDASLRRLGSRLTLRRGPAATALAQLARETGAGAVCWNRRYEPAARQQEDAVTAAMESAGIRTQVFNGSLLHDPWAVSTAQGGPYRVFTPFWRTCREAVAAAGGGLSAAPKKLRAPAAWPASEPLESLALLPKADWAGGLRESWLPGETGAQAALKRFIKEGVTRYDVRRDQPAEPGTSRLSPHLHWGEISPSRVLTAIRKAGGGSGAEAAERQLYWREFAHHLLFHFPHTAERPLREAFERFPWRRDRKALRAWQQGRTGQPIVDAGMRELWRTGWMHNRVRMIAASFLVKDLLAPWQDGARWFWDTLVDADLANNTLGWQWVAGCGADAAPFFRIFNPAVQGEKFDPSGEYARRWIPELAGLDGRTYPRPIVDHRQAAMRALAAYGTLRKG